LNAGELRISVVTRGRRITGLHVCSDCARRLAAAWAGDEQTMVAASATPWSGPCDLCRIEAPREPTGISTVRSPDA
jgi:hypothetical protein